MKVTNLKFGYEVKDVDYSSKKDAKEIVQLIGDGRFVIVKNPKFVEPETILELYNNIGIVGCQSDEVKVAGLGKANGNKEFVRVRTDSMFAGDPKKDGELEWHNAGTNTHTADQIVAMYIVAPSEEGGLTGFTDAQTAFSDLPKDKQELLEMYTIEFPIWNPLDESHPWTRGIFMDPKQKAAFLSADENKAVGRQIQFRPLVTEHPANGKSGFQFPWELVYRIVELSSIEKSKEFIAWLTEHLLQDKYVYWHDWDIYDIALSDQLHSLHKRTSYKGYRELFRSAINYDDGKDFWY